MGNKALVILSGGQDSALCLGWAVSVFDNVSTISFDYNQRHKRELDCAKELSCFFQTDFHHVVQAGGVFIGGSPLVNHNALLEQYKDYDHMTRIIGDRQEVTMVPMRNSIFLDIAASRASITGYNNIVIGVSADDSANYDDCRIEYIRAMEHAINLALGKDHRDKGNAISIHAPIINLTKSECVEFGLTVPGVYESWAYTHTAYDGKYPPVGKDHASILRAFGFEEAGIPDPLVVRAWLEKKMDLPDSKNYDIVRKNDIRSISDLCSLVGAVGLGGTKYPDIQIEENAESGV